MKTGIKVHGYDLALTHSAVVELTDGELTGYWYITPNKTSYKKGLDGDHSTLLNVKKMEDKQQMHMERLSIFRSWLNDLIAWHPADFIGIEDYAIKSTSYAHLVGEIGGAARLLCSDSKTLFRLHDPLSIKLFTTGKGNSKKPAMEAAVLEEYGVDFTRYNKSEKDHTTSEDLCDSYAVAKMVWLEYQLRHGLIELKDLGEEKIRVLNRVTKSYPINILGRSWIGQEEG